jgi:pyruvyltransferase
MLRKTKNYFKKFSSIRKYHKKIKKRLWSFSDYIYKYIYSMLGRNVVKTHYARLNNFGDRFNVDLLDYLGYKLMYVDNWKEADIALTGSILQHYGGPFQGKILGAGFIDNKITRINNSWDVKIIRGPLSAEQCGVLKKKVTFADPGILANIIFPIVKVKKYKIGIVPHYVDYDFAKSIFSNQKNVKVINVRKKPYQVAKEINECASIASSSLHGLIFADAYRIPNIHLKFSDLLFGGLHKFKDYYYGMDASYEFLEYDENLSLDKLVKSCKLRYTSQYLKQRQQKILDILALELSLFKK